MADAELALVRISIHALREEGDLALSSRPYQSAIFLSTPSARRATAGALGTAYASNISIHALREEGDGRCTGYCLRQQHFYPRPPRGGRPALGCIGGNVDIDFYPRPPRGGRQTPS